MLNPFNVIYVMPCCWRVVFDMIAWWSLLLGFEDDLNTIIDSFRSAHEAALTTHVDMMENYLQRLEDAITDNYKSIVGQGIEASFPHTEGGQYASETNNIIFSGGADNIFPVPYQTATQMATDDNLIVHPVIKIAAPVGTIIQYNGLTIHTLGVNDMPVELTAGASFTPTQVTKELNLRYATDTAERLLWTVTGPIGLECKVDIQGWHYD